MADRFWVGGTGTWDASSTTNWSATTGGAGGASVPTSADTVTFNASSGTSFTVTIATGYDPVVGAVSGGAASVTLDINNQNLTCTSFNFSGTSVRLIAFGSSGRITVTGNAAQVFTIQIDTNLTCSGSKNVYFTYSGGTGTRTISTCTAGAIATNGLNYYFQGGTDIITISGASGIIVRDIDFTGFSGTQTTNVIRAYGNITLSATMTLTNTATTWNFQGPSGGTQTFTTAGMPLPVGITVNAAGGNVVLADNVSGPTVGALTLTAGTLNLNNQTINIGTFASNGSTVRSIDFGTSGVINLKRDAATVWNGSTATNFTYTGVGNVNFTANVASGNRTLAHGSTAGSFPTNLPPPFNFTAGTDNIITTPGGSFNSFNFTGFGGNLTNTARAFYGNVTLSPAMTLIGGANPSSFTSSGTQTVDTANLTIPFPLFVGSGGAGSNGVVELANALTLNSANTLTLTSGTLSTNGLPVTAGLFNASGNLYRVLDLSNNTIELTGGGNVWNVVTSTNFILNSANSTILANNASGNPTLLLGNGVAYDNVVFAGAGISTIYPSGNVTINTLSSPKTGPQTVVFNGNATNYTTVNNWNIVGDASNTVSLTSDNGTQFNLVYGGNSNVDVSYHTITNSVASPANKWYALFTNNNANGGNNSGWIFTLPAATSSNFFLVF